MNLNIMREYVKLAELRNFSKTAEDLYVTQSSLSRHIASLEEELGTVLIKRTRNSFELTQEGEMVRDEFASILSSYENLLFRLSKNDDLQKIELRLGVLYYDMEFYVARIRETLLARYPNVKLILQSYQPRQLEENLLEGRIDAAIIYGVDDCPRRDIRHIPFLKIPYVLIYNKGHRLSQVRDLNISDLDGEKLLIPEQSLDINHVAVRLQRMLEEGGVRISEYIKISNYDEVPWLLKETGAIYIAPMANARAYGDTTEFRYLLADRFSADVSLVWKAGHDNPAVNILGSAVKICFP